MISRRLLVCALLLGPALRAQDDAPAVKTLTADFGYVAVSGNTSVTSLSIGDKFTWNKARHTIEQSFGIVRGEQDGVENTNNLRAGLRWEYKIAGLFSAFVATNYDRNTFAGISRRFEEQLGLVWRAVGSSTDTLRFDAGASLTQQRSTTGLESDFPAGRAAGLYKHAFTGSSYFEQRLEYLPNFKTPRDWRLNTETSLVAPISTRIGLKVGYAIRYDNQPEPTFQTVDRLFVTSIQLTY